MISRDNGGIQWASNLLFCSSWFAVKVVLRVLIEKRYKDSSEFRAYIELAKLSLQLADLCIETSPDLLKDAEVQQTDYKVRLNGSRLPVIQQNKYILIPTYDDKKDTSLLQEHELGSEEYILSIGSPKKATQFKPVFNI